MILLYISMLIVWVYDFMIYNTSTYKQQLKMNAFTITFCLVLYGLTLLCFFLPFKNGQKVTGKIVGVILGIVITLTVIGNLDFLIIFIWPLIAVFQIIFISYWSFRIFGRRKTGKIVAIVFTTAFLLLLMQPWISDWTFNKKDVKKILAFHNLELKDDFKILKNESFGFKDYRETFILKLSDNDFNRISQSIKSSKSYKGFFRDYSNAPSVDTQNDTVDFETTNYFEREYSTNRKMENGTYHFWFQLDKQKKELEYNGSDE
ncbi:hypothetical protein GON26_17035 [Flavobacterium sp. GA093]|uniref:Uncharacterized protein n=1 Tax=Flavobacterium hydrocarbonoxydans TaxID=2683249 RepID=A0A6I4NPG8_9FLAO|nr:hypothetical protein [Flavobacterium hydrocarbonoxydans]MWB96073.1 hypothetical protein [Flavobacterium hydrocarbonoxydans]